jgi:tRNA G10  N-methylase Trm11
VETHPDLIADCTRVPLPDNNFSAALCDAPYTQDDAEHYRVKTLPSPNELLKEAVRLVKPGGRVGFLHYICPHPPKNVKFVACVGVLVGFNNRVRIYSVFEKEAAK